ncbi:hypothetical protein DRN98_01310 [Methanosarcinales archaeon]|uniref:Uncharacterized protein n=1 Tax=Candidatus Syntropharchaeum caldarium TaxID=1838285 RepID=A0A1F2P920_9EURY|nr:hypothetical protein [Candidatus Syntrophoarchaeum sp.]OFV67683.1 MAG: conserved hypothetical protein, membrane [Candidatus Syntrophoarchaeum caldarius]RLG35412.1 MAG: hypothetical protein DRN98_01310 [Methanosarcinales archaeon]
MDALSIITLILIVVFVLEIVIMLLRLEVEKMLLLFPIIGVIFLSIAFVLNEYSDRYFTSLSEAAIFALVYGTIIIGVLLGLIGILVWFRGEKSSKGVLAQARTMDSVVGGVESEIREGERELAYFADELEEMRERTRSYELRGGK